MKEYGRLAQRSIFSVGFTVQIQNNLVGWNSEKVNLPKLKSTLKKGKQQFRYEEDSINQALINQNDFLNRTTCQAISDVGRTFIIKIMPAYLNNMA